MTAEVSRRASGPRYPQLLCSPVPRWWRPLIGLLLAAVTLAACAVVVVLAALVVATVSGQTTDPFGKDSLAPDTPLGLLANNLVIAMLVPASVLAVAVVHRSRVGSLVSVTGRVRWGLLLRCLGVALVVVVLFFAVSFLLPAELDPVEGSHGAAPSTSTLVGLLAVILLTTPLQAAAEEVGFRGYLSQAVASWFARPVFGTVVAGAVSAMLFALAHGAQDRWLFGDRLTFGVVASWLAWRTGGLEAPVALHIANNLVSLSYTALTGSLESALTASSLAWQFAVLDVAMMVTFAVVVHTMASRWRVLERRTEPAGALSGARQVGYPEPRSPAPPPAGSEHPWGMG